MPIKTLKIKNKTKTKKIINKMIKKNKRGGSVRPSTLWNRVSSKYIRRIPNVVAEHVPWNVPEVFPNNVPEAHIIHEQPLSVVRRNRRVAPYMEPVATPINNVEYNKLFDQLHTNKDRLWEDLTSDEQRLLLSRNENKLKNDLGPTRWMLHIHDNMGHNTSLFWMFYLSYIFANNRPWDILTEHEKAKLKQSYLSIYAVYNDDDEFLSEMYRLEFRLM